jgi:glycosyltransferase involved in cell wall biosynthesis
MIERHAAFLTGKRLLFLVNVDWFFLSHRLPLALAAKEHGADVVVAAADTGRGPAIEAAGLRFLPVRMSRQGRNPLGEARAMVAVARLLRRERPDLVHQVAVKPVLYGSLVGSVVARGTPRINAISGLGFSFSEDQRARRIRRLVRALYRIALRAGTSITIFQNQTDLDAFVASGLVERARTVLIRGSGVDLARFQPSPLPAAPVVILASRMLWEKGVHEFITAAAIVRERLPEVRFVLVGGPDDGNPTAIDSEQLRQWQDGGGIEWWGHRSDMPEVLSMATIVALPTFYPEGVPKVLLEAAASARPIVASDIAGCREVVKDGVNGLLVPPRDPAALADAIIALLKDPALCVKFGQSGRSIAERYFGEELVVEQTLEIYRRLLGPTTPPGTGLAPLEAQPPGS